MKNISKFHMFLLILAGTLISAMLVMMRLGGSINFQEFMSAGRVYDFEPRELQQNSKNWIYEKENKGHRLLKKRAQIKFLLDGGVQTWDFLYINVAQLSKDPVDGLLKYYDGEDKKILEQSISLSQGNNMIQMDGSLSISKIGILLSDVQGEFISITKMQIRTTPSWFTPMHFLSLFAVAFAGVMAMLVLFDVLLRRFRKGRTAGAVWVVLEGIQSGINAAGDAFGGRLGGRLYQQQRESLRRFLFSLLFVWMMVGNAAGWLKSTQMYRYHVLVCALLLLFISFVSWERPLQNRSWRGPLMKSWLGIWLGTVFCDFFVVRQLESITGYAMLFAGSIFVYFWQNMERPRRMFLNMIEALEATFFLSIFYCMIFRMKRPAVDYNGIFKSPEELAMYGVLMAVVFLVRLDWYLTKSGSLLFCVKTITGGALSLFLVLRSGHAVGTAIIIIIGILYIPISAKKLYNMAGRYQVLLVSIIMAAIFAYACTAVVFISIKYFPGILGMDLKYQNELLLTGLMEEEQELYLLQYPTGLSGVQTKEAEKIPIIWQNYGRRLNLFGHGGECVVFRRIIPPYNSYLDMAYHHGIFILLPYAVYQVMVVVLGIRCAVGKKGRRNLFPLFIGIAYLCFSFCANVEIAWGHPLWLCYYLLVGLLGRPEIEKT